MFGPSILVAPVTDYKARTKEVYLPSSIAVAGKHRVKAGWYDLYTGQYYAGANRVTAQAPLGKIPLFVREGSIIPAGPDIQYAEQKPNDDITLYVYTGKDAEFTLYEDENDNNSYMKNICAMIQFHYSERTGRLTIDAPKDSYPRMPETRTFHVIWIEKSHPQGFLSSHPKEETLIYRNERVVLTRKSG
jgi:alpha-D-xyloside xylohydrolase